MTAELYVHRSNRMERLVEALARVVAEPLQDPLAAELIVVEGRGMERWLARELAEHFSVWANAEFPFPRRFIDRLLRAASHDDTADPYAPEQLRWSIAAALVDRLQQTHFAPLERYLDDASDIGKLLALSERIGSVFDKYIVFRPDLVARWERGQDDHWQAHLWRALVAQLGNDHQASRAAAFRRAVAELDASALPQRVSLFGLSALAPLYVDVLETLASRIPVHLFVLSPSSEYWGWIRGKRETLRRAKAAPGPDLETELAEAAGHPLLASLGRVGREFQESIEANVDYREVPDAPSYVTPDGDRVLATLQRQILELHAPREARPLVPGDDSLRVHACHGPMREVQVLHDEILELLESDPSVEPHDIVVLCPAIDEYAPFIEAVFAGDNAADGLLFRIADRRSRATDEVIDALLRTIVILGGRLPASDVVDLLEFAPVRERFAIEAADIDTIRAWTREAGIRWGIDGSHKTEYDLPALGENTWRFGLDRLFLGYSMDAYGDRLFDGVLPTTELIEGASVSTLGALASFCETLFGWRDETRTARSLREWATDLGRMMTDLLGGAPAHAAQLQQARDALHDLAGQAEAAGFETAIPLEVVARLLESWLEQDTPGRTFLSGGITFCAMVPMRSIPFKVVCMLGMGEDRFPRRDRAFGFDLTSTERRMGDRNARDDDRYLFLEAILSARRALRITYTGRALRDNSPLPPSTVVSELLDTVDAAFDAPDGAPASQALVVEHPLQAFSHRYFDRRDPKLHSYDKQQLTRARARLGRPTAPPPFVGGPLPPAETDDDAGATVSIDTLAGFFERPSRGYLTQRLSLYLGQDDDELEDREPIELDALDGWKIGDRILDILAADNNAPEPLLRAAGLLPPGSIGAPPLATAQRDAEEILRRAATLREGTPLEPRPVDLLFDHNGRQTRIVGALDALWRSGMVRVQYSKLGRRQELGAWVRHLALNAQAPDNTRPETFLVGRGAAKDTVRTVRFRPVEDARDILSDLVALYRIGLELPLALLPKASREYVDKLAKGDPTQAMARARSAYWDNGGQPGSGDANDDWVRQVFRGRDPLAANRDLYGDAGIAFEEISGRVLGPLLAHREEVG